MTKNAKVNRVVVNIFALLFLIGGTFVAIMYAKGYRPNIKNGSLQGSGLLSVTSYPKSARVMIDGKLTTVTDDKLYLTPGNYNIKIEKDGFHPWTKTVPLKSELVSNADARLFPIINATSPLTFYQVSNTSVNPDGTKIAYVLTKSPVDTANGLYVHSLSGNLFGSQYIQVASNESKDFTKALLIWSPDSTQILAVFTEKNKIISTLLLSTKGLNNLATLTDITTKLPQIITQWQDQYAKINQPTLALYPKFLTDILLTKATNVFFSPDKEMVLYTPSMNINLPENAIGQALPNINATTETRNLTKDKTYVFDLKEGTNYLVPSASNSAEIKKIIITTPDATPSASITTLKQLKAQTESYTTGNVSWYSNSHQLIITNKDGVSIVDYDGLNLTPITYVQPLLGFVVSNPDGSRLILLTNINQKPDTYNLISFDLK